jgi:tetratricopeptide (TPR) repeat protein
MKNDAVGARVSFLLPSLIGAIILPAVPQGHADTTAAIAARNSSDVGVLRRLISEAQQRAGREKTAQAYQTLAQLDLWLCEVGHGRNENKVIKEAAEEGAAAAEKAIAIDPNSSEAHRLEGESLSQLIPHVFAGGPRLGPRSTRELDKAIELDPKNANAYIARAYNYFFTPKAFGGDKQRAAEMLQKAIDLDPNSDTAHVWLAQVYLALGEKEDALREVNIALRFDPSRAFTQYVYRQIAGSDHSLASKPPSA